MKSIQVPYGTAGRNPKTAEGLQYLRKLCINPKHACFKNLINKVKLCVP